MSAAVNLLPAHPKVPGGETNIPTAGWGYMPAIVSAIISHARVVVGRVVVTSPPPHTGNRCARLAKVGESRERPGYWGRWVTYLPPPATVVRVLQEWVTAYTSW